MDEVGNNYFLDTISSGTGPELKFNGAPVVDGQFGPYVPVGVEQTATGYEVALKNASTNQFSIWNTDSNGNFLSLCGLPGTSAALESLETSFHQDLNGDGVIGVPTMVISAAGSTSLVEVGNNYFLNPVGSGTGPELKYNGAPVVVGQFGSLCAGRRGTDGGRLRSCLKNAGTNQFSIWNTDSNGNFLSLPSTRGTAPRWKRWRPASIRTSTATASSVFMPRPALRSRSVVLCPAHQDRQRSGPAPRSN